MTEKRLKRPRDPFQFAKLIGGIATGQVEDVAPPSKAEEGKAYYLPIGSPEGETEAVMGASARQ